MSATLKINDFYHVNFKHLASLILVLFCTNLCFQFAQAQNFGIAYTLAQRGQNANNFALATVDLQTGVVSIISNNVAFAGPYSAADYPAVDEITGVFYALKYNGTNSSLSRISTTTGQILSVSQLPGIATRLDLNCSGDLFTLNRSVNVFAKINPNNTFTNYASPVPIALNTSDRSTVNTTTNKYIMIQGTNTNNIVLREIDLATGVGTTILIPNTLNILNAIRIMYNCVNDKLYCTATTNGSVYKFYEVDLANNQLIPLSGAGYSGTPVANKPIINPFTNYTHFITGPNTNPRIATFDLTTGNFVQSVPVQNPLGGTILWLANPTSCNPTAGFSYTNTCLGDTSVFTPSFPANKIYWNFGDTASGNLNTDSTFVGQHFYTSPGVYTVTQIVIGCNSSDTISQQIVVQQQFTEPFQTTDTLLCQGDTLILDALTTAAQTTWQDGSTASTYTVTSQNIYTVEISDSICFLADTITVNYLQPPFVNLGNDSVLCSPDSIFISAQNNGANYLWNTLDTTQQIFVKVPGVYSVTVSNAVCSVVDSLVLSVSPVSGGPKIISDTLICLGDSFQLDYSEFISVQINVAFTAPQGTFTVADTGLFTITYSDGFCTATDSIQVNYALTTTPFDSVGHLCFDSVLTLNPEAQSLLGPPNYQWNTGQNTATITITEPSFYQVTVSNSRCSIVQGVEVQRVVVQKLLADSSIICPNDTLVLTPFGLGANYVWNFGDTNRVVAVNAENLYQVDFVYRNCPFKDSILVKHLPIPPLEVADTLIFCSSTAAEYALTTTFDSVFWSTLDTGQIATFSQSGTYFVEATYCNIKQFKQFEVELLNANAQYVFMPNAFSPNNDGINETIHPTVHPLNVLSFDFRVFNSWGELVFESQEFTESWDGTHKGLLGPPENYTYQLDIRFRCPSPEFKRYFGTIQLLR